MILHKLSTMIRKQNPLTVSHTSATELYIKTCSMMTHVHKMVK